MSSNANGADPRSSSDGSDCASFGNSSARNSGFSFQEERRRALEDSRISAGSRHPSDAPGDSSPLLSANAGAFVQHRDQDGGISDEAVLDSPSTSGDSGEGRAHLYQAKPTASALAAEGPSAGHIVGSSGGISVVRDIATSIARRRSTVMLLGETGTGKEMLARHIHDHSERAGKPFVPVDCSAMTETLFESQLFGHVRGAFTGAVRDSLGFVRAADGGTLFIDEVGELSLLLQAKLLRVLQERCVVPVGDTRAKSVDVRVVCATHRDLASMVRAGTFREDLYFRLNVVVLQVPPLRERPEDVIPLAQHFLSIQADLYDEEAKVLSRDAGELLRSYPWPGNVRELANVIEHAHVLASGGVIRPTDLPDRLRRPAGSGVTTPSNLRLLDVERRTIAEALHRTKNCKAAASRLLGINVQRLSRRIKSLGIDLPGSN